LNIEFVPSASTVCGLSSSSTTAGQVRSHEYLLAPKGTDEFAVKDGQGPLNGDAVSLSAVFNAKAPGTCSFNVVATVQVVGGVEIVAEQVEVQGRPWRSCPPWSTSA
jgi:hypothetical protein